MENGDEEEGERERGGENGSFRMNIAKVRERERGSFVFWRVRVLKEGGGLGVEELKSVECGNGRRGGRNYMQDTYSCVCVCVSARRG